MSQLLLGFGRLRPWLGHLEPARRHMYLLDDQGIGYALGRTPGGLASGVFGTVDGGVTTGVVITRKTLSSTFFAMDTTALWAAPQAHCAPTPPCTPLPARYPCTMSPLGKTNHCQGELVQPGL